jgi:hypothetical protein
VLAGGSLLLLFVFLCFVFSGFLLLPVSCIYVVALHISFMLAATLTLMFCCGVVVVRQLTLCVNVSFFFFVVAPGIRHCVSVHCVVCVDRGLPKARDCVDKAASNVPVAL